MSTSAKLGWGAALVTLLAVPALTRAQVPDPDLSYFVPQAVVGGVPCEGNTGNCGGIGGGAIRNFRSCPNNDGNLLANQARLKVVAIAGDGTAIEGIAASDICINFNGGTAAQGFGGSGDDSIAANSALNGANHCPDVLCIPADGPTDASGTAYITLVGPGGVRDPMRKWGNWAGDIPVTVLGVQIQGKLTSDAELGSYTCHIRSLDTQGNTTLLMNVAEAVNSLDLNALLGTILSGGGGCVPDNATNYKYDFDNNGCIGSTDLNLFLGHLAGTGSHSCRFPNDP